MSDLNEKNLDELEEDNENYITLTDEEGNDISFEILDTVQYNDRLFAVLLPFDDNDEDDGIVILEIIPAEDPEYDDFVSVEDEALLDNVFEEFKKNYNGEYEFE